MIISLVTIVFEMPILLNIYLLRVSVGGTCKGYLLDESK